MKLSRSLGSFLSSLGKSLSGATGAFLRGEDLPDGGEGAKLVTPYAQSAWVFIAVTRLAEAVSKIPFRISRVGSGTKANMVRSLRYSASGDHQQRCRRALGETIIESGDVVDLFQNPHPTMTASFFWEMVVTWLALRGEYFILPMDGSDQPVDLSDRRPNIERLITLPTDMFWHNVSGYDLVNWRYTGSPLLTPIPSEVLLPDEVIHSRSPNPYLFWRGMSPLIVAAVAAGSDYAATQYAKGYWLNNADTGVIVTTDQQASAEQQAAIGAALRERKRKAGTADRPLFLWGGAKVDKPQLSGMETQFIENRKMNRQEIAAIYKVPDSVMGFSEAKASALSGGGNALQQDMISFFENAITPICSRLEDSVARVVSSFGNDLVGWFDLDSVPIMQQARRDRVDTAVKIFGIGVPLNDINVAYDLGFKEYPWGKKGFLPFNLQEAGEPAVLPGEDDPEKPDGDDDGGKDKSNPFARMHQLLTNSTPLVGPLQRQTDTQRLWESHVASRSRSVKMFKGKVGKVLRDYRARTLAKLSEIHFDKSFEKKSLIDLIFDAHSFGADLLNELTNPIRATLNLGGKELTQEVGSDDPWEMTPAQAKEFIAKRTIPIKGVGGTVRDQLNTSLQQGLDNGETTDQLSARVRSVFNALNDYEAERVARTEVNIAYNFARDLAMKDAGIDYKAWLSSHGPHVREAHADAEEAYIDDPIPVEEPFIVGGEQLMYPGDDSLGASLGNIINCQCIQLAAEKSGEDEKSLTFKIYGAGKMNFPKPS